MTPTGTGSPALPLLKPDCARCFGLCCVALPLTRSADFPVDKAAGDPCRNLAHDFRCTIHGRLRDEGWKGCTVYDCFGAGQQVSQVTFAGVSWRDAPETATRMFAVLPVMRQVHEVLALVGEALALDAVGREDPTLRVELEDVRADAAALTSAGPDALLALDLGALRRRVGPLLSRASRAVRERHRRDHARGRPDRRGRPGADLVGADLRGADLQAADLRGALLIATDLRHADLRRADLLGADLRDADLRGADLRGALFLTRPQLAAARIGVDPTRPDATLT